MRINAIPSFKGYVEMPVRFPGENKGKWAVINTNGIIFCPSSTHKNLTEVYQGDKKYLVNCPYKFFKSYCADAEMRPGRIVTMASGLFSSEKLEEDD